VINLIRNTTTKKGLEIVCVKDDNKYVLGIKVTDKELAQINIVKDVFHGDWNYAILSKK
jgi:rRNA processing protein Gar1